MRVGWLLPLVVLLVGCGRDEGGAPEAPPPRLLAPGEAIVWSADDAPSPEVAALAKRVDVDAELASLEIDYPQDGSVFPPDIAAPTILWHDGATPADTWLVRFAFSDGQEPVWALVDGPPPKAGEIDREALGATNEVYRPTPHQASAHAWRPPAELWAAVKRRTIEKPATLTFCGFRARTPQALLSRGAVTIRTSTDRVGAPIFYRDVPLMPALAERSGQIQPIKMQALPLITWRIKDIGRDDSRAVLRGMPSCANCHSFSQDGRTLAMDVDGPNGDKGAYAIVPVEKDVRITPEHVITWNSFPDKPDNLRTIGFLSRVSPDGKWVLSTVNESLYVANFTDYRILQVFYPTRGILACYSTETGTMWALGGAADPAYVHCNPVWSPDGKTVVFLRAKAMESYVPGEPLATQANDPNEPRVLYDIYRLEFNEGRGGTPVAVEGASDNGMSNTFPKVSPDGKWIVFTKCRNGLLLRPDGKLWIVPLRGGEARELACNLPLMNSWHSFSPNGRWLVWSSKSNTPYTQMFLTHLDEGGGASPAILIENATAANRAVNIPEFLNASYDALRTIQVPAVNHHLFFARASELLEQDRYTEAVEYLKKALEVDPDFSRAHTALAYCLLRSDAVEEAEQHIQRSLAIDPESPGALAALGGLRLRQGRAAEARHHYRQALRYAPQMFIALRNLGLILMEEGQDAEALDHLRRALAIDSADIVAHRAAGELLVRKGSPQGIVALSRALSLAPDDLELRTRLAWVQATHPVAALRSGANALALAEEASGRSHHLEPLPLAALAAAQAELGRFEDAVRTAREAQALATRANPALAREIGRQVQAYEERRPWREPADRR